MRLRTLLVRAVVVLLTVLPGPEPVFPEDSTRPTPAPWQSRAVPEARGEVRVVNGKPLQVRYDEEPFTRVKERDWSVYRTYAYDDDRPLPAVKTASPPPGVRGDASRGREIFMSRSKGPCMACHLIPGEDVWPAGHVGVDLSKYGDRYLPDPYIYQIIYDPRVFLSRTAVSMPPWGAMGLLEPGEIVHLVAFLQTLKSPVPAESDPSRDPKTRVASQGFGDNLDPTNNPAIILAEDALPLWRQPGPKGKSCNDCHEGGLAASMKSVATRYPRHVESYGRIMSLGDLLQMHGPETTGDEYPSQGDDNVNMVTLIKMASNGLPLNVDVTSPLARAALRRGEATFNKKVGQRNHACADCHTTGQGRGAGRFLGGRLLADVSVGLVNHFPTWRTNFQVLWDLRRRFQWCMLPLGTNMLAADSVEYAELELYLASFSNGKPLDVPGIRH